MAPPTVVACGELWVTIVAADVLVPFISSPVPAFATGVLVTGVDVTKPLVVGVVTSVDTTVGTFRLFDSDAVNRSQAV
uniref:Putative secreted protein n=1 Tax=Anopheles darlingi TaxID=43151 RepID=A0A2M4D298_ANODA